MPPWYILCAVAAERTARKLTLWQKKNGCKEDLVEFRETICIFTWIFSLWADLLDSGSIRNTAMLAQEQKQTVHGEGLFLQRICPQALPAWRPRH
jgi:hypothetical protein